MQRKPIQFIGYCLDVGLIAVLTIVMSACSLIPNSPPAASAASSGPATPASTAPLIIPPTAAANSSTSAQNVVVNLPSFADLISMAAPSVVQIDTSGTATTSRGRTVLQQGAGSGWILDASGMIVTNNHVVTGATSITVTTLNGKEFPAQVINTDAVNDLALLKINAPQLTSIKVGDASKLRTGDWVLAIGNPLGQGIIATQGIVSRLGVNVPVSSTQTYNDLIETTAAINPGNS